MTEYEYQVLTFPREVERSVVRQTLTDHAEYGHWELARTRLYLGGLRKVWWRRRDIRVRRTA